MTDLLIKLFIKDKENFKNAAVRQKYGTLSSIVGITVNLLISAVKLILGLISASVALVADSLNNLSDAGSSIVTMVSFRLSGKPADKDHPFGHARIEYIASMIVSFLILIVGFEMFTSSVSAIIKGKDAESVSFSTLSIIIVAVTLLFKLWLGIFYTKIGKKINSSVVKASGVDSFLDSISTLAVLICAIIIKLTGFVLLDAIVGIGVSLLIFTAGIKILNATKNSLLGEAPNEEILGSILEIVKSYPDVIGTHDILIHNYGPNHHLASFHAEVDGAKDVFAMHDVIDNLEKEIASRLNILCTIHMDPIVTDDEVINEKRLIVTEIAEKEIGAGASIHDFRMVVGDTHTNLIFDLILPYESRLCPKDAVAKVEKAVNDKYKNHFCVITIDRA